MDVVSRPIEREINAFAKKMESLAVTMPFAMVVTSELGKEVSTA